MNLKKSKAEASGWVAIALDWGAAVAIAVYVVGTMGMAIVGSVERSLVVPFIIAQMLGGILGAVLVWLTYLPHFKETEEPSILGTSATGPAIKNTPANFLTETIVTFVRVFVIMMFGQQGFADGLNPLIVGLLIVSIGLSLGESTGYAINPSRDLGPSIAHQIFPIANKGQF